jgi:cytochrome c peroxidase
LLFEVKAIPWNAGEPGDVLDPILTDRPGKFRRLLLGGRPLTVAFVENQDKAVIANYLQDTLQVVDCEAGKVVQTIPLGPSAPPSLARKGEALFYDAQRSTHQWFSCNTCHVEGHTCGLNFDTLNDDSYGNPKLTPTLRNVTHTGPYTWHGWQKDLGAAVEKSLTQTMFGTKPTAEEKQALLAFLETLGNPPNPHRGPGGKLSAGAERGEKLFRGKAGCIRCHRGPYYTSPGTYDVKLEADDSPYDLWNPPSLLGLWDRGPYLHDGRSKTLEELLTEDHTPDKVGGENLTDAERKDLIAFLLSL